jgi:tetratricopeptide (TPR) repeat protein
VNTDHDRTPRAACAAEREPAARRKNFPRRAALAGWAALAACLGACAAAGAKPFTGDETNLRRRAEEASLHQDWERAAELWGECARIEQGRHPRPYAELAKALRATGERAEAHAALCAGLDLFPGDRQLLAARAYLASEMGFHRAAERDFEQALEIDERDAALWEGLGRARLALELPEAAKAALVRCLHAAPETPERVALLARALSGARDLEHAAEAWERALVLCRARAEPPLEWQLAAADALASPELGSAGGECAGRALELYEKVLARDPQCARASFAVGRLLEQRGDFDRALAAYLRAVEVDSFHVDALERLAVIYANAGDRERANEMVERALAVEKSEARRRTLREILAVAGEPSADGG